MFLEMEEYQLDQAHAQDQEIGKNINENQDQLLMLEVTLME